MLKTCGGKHVVIHTYGTENLNSAVRVGYRASLHFQFRYSLTTISDNDKHG